jgi:hypothetical protein
MLSAPVLLGAILGQRGRKKTKKVQNGLFYSHFGVFFSARL